MQVSDGSNNDIESIHNSEALAEAESVSIYGLPTEEKAEWDIRNDHIADNILHVASKHPGKRIAVVYGRTHYVPLAHRLQEHTYTEVIPTTDFLPLSEQEVEAAWHNDDAILLLGTNLDSWKIPGAPQSRNHQRSKYLLDRLSSAHPRSAATQYICPTMINALIISIYNLSVPL